MQLGIKKKISRTKYSFLRKMISMIMIPKIPEIQMIALKMSFILKREKV